MRPEFPKRVWNYNVMEDRTHDRVKFRILNVLNEVTDECLVVRVGAHAYLTKQLNVREFMQTVEMLLRSD